MKQLLKLEESWLNTCVTSFDSYFLVFSGTVYAMIMKKTTRIWIFMEHSALNRATAILSEHLVCFQGAMTS